MESGMLHRILAAGQYQYFEINPELYLMGRVLTKNSNAGKTVYIK